MVRGASSSTAPRPRAAMKTAKQLKKEKKEKKREKKEKKKKGKKQKACHGIGC